MRTRPADRLLRDPQALCLHASDRLYPSSNPDRDPNAPLASSSAVLLLLCPAPDDASRVCLVLNKRSGDVRQPGDLCLPGGGISPTLDAALSRLLRLPNSPMRAWPSYARWRSDGGNPLVPLLLTASLREGFEEMKLDPFNPMLLGLLPPQRLVARSSAIHPVVAWLRHQQTYRPNWEVERVVMLPLEHLLDARRHETLRARCEVADQAIDDRLREDYGCLEIDGELLWGLTYRILERFLQIVLDVTLPSLGSRRRRELVLPNDYFTRTRR